MIIYKVTNLINGKLYIGQTVRTLDERKEEHFRKRKSILSQAIRKYGKENFVFEVIDTAETVEGLNEKEIQWITFYNCLTPYGYNQCEGGGNTKGYHHSEVSKMVMRDRKQNYTGGNNPFYGKHHTSTQRERWSGMRKGLMHLTAEQVQALRASHFTQRVLCVETGEVFDSIKEAAEKYSIKPTHITRVCKGLRKRTGGYHWKYVNT